MQLYTSLLNLVKSIVKAITQLRNTYAGGKIQLFQLPGARGSITYFEGALWVSFILIVRCVIGTLFTNLHVIVYFFWGKLHAYILLKVHIGEMCSSETKITHSLATLLRENEYLSAPRFRGK